MGNQPSKGDFVDHLNEKRIRSSMRKMSINFDEPNLLKKKTLISPVRHQLVLSDHASLLTPLTKTKPTRSMSSTCSMTSEEGEPRTPTAVNYLKSSSYDDPIMIHDVYLKNRLSSSLPVQYQHGNLLIETPIQNKPSMISENVSIYEYGAEKERDRQTRQHYLLKQVLKGNLHVHLDNPKRILDSACGVGLWTLEMAHDFPKCQVVGIDVVPPSEKEGWSLSPKSKNETDNFTFQHGDILKPSLAFPDNYFDFIYQRDVSTVLPFTFWPNLIAEFFRMSRPGGQIQLVEYDLLFKRPGPVLTKVNEWYRLAAGLIGIDPEYSSYLTRYLEDAGFIDIDVQVVTIAIGEWPDNELDRQYGFLYKEQMKSLFKSMKRWWCLEIKLTEDEYDRVCAEALEEFEEYHSSAEWKIFTARKP